MSHILHTIETKREGGGLCREQIRDFVQGYAAGEIPDYQASALLMAIFLQGMTANETVQLTEEMLHSGITLQWPGDEPHVLDKHSTGGVGDKTSLIIAPLLAASGYRVPMISGRGLGATGGTLDKLESIPGLQTGLTREQITQQVRELGCVMCGATAEIAPADRKLYALRDVTATVASIPLITASILSKKLAEGLHGLVLDVKWGSGAFMREFTHAKALAESLVRVSSMLGVPARALLTDMNQPLGRTAGNAIEVNEVREVLQGAGPADVRELSLRLTAEAISLVEDEGTVAGIVRSLETKLDQGVAWEMWERMVAVQGGETTDVLPVYDPVDVPALEDGYLSAIDAKKLGEVIGQLGGGRQRLDDVIDPAVGLTQLKRLGEPVTAGEPILQLHVRPADRDHLTVRPPAEEDSPLRHLLSAISILPEPCSAPDLIVETIDADSLASATE